MNFISQPMKKNKIKKKLKNLGPKTIKKTNQVWWVNPSNPWIRKPGSTCQTCKLDNGLHWD